MESGATICDAKVYVRMNANCCIYGNQVNAMVNFSFMCRPNVWCLNTSTKHYIIQSQLETKNSNILPNFLWLSTSINITLYKVSSQPNIAT